MSSVSGTPALVARTATAFARVATLRALDKSGQWGPQTTVRISAACDGDLLLRLDSRSNVAARLTSKPDAVVTVAAPAPFSMAELTGMVRPAAQPEGPREHPALRSDPGCCLYRLTVTGVRLLAKDEAIEVALPAFWAAHENLLALQAPAMLEHLAKVHGKELLASVRAHIDPSIEVVLPRSLDSYGLRLTTVSAQGVGEVNMAFPGAPARSAHQVAAHLRAALSCPCSSRQTPPSSLPDSSQ